MDLIQAIRDRRAVRDYQEEIPEPSLVDELIGLAIWAPNSMNRQGWSFLVIEDRGDLVQISHLAKGHLRRVADEQAELKVLSPMLTDQGFNIFYNAPVLVVICSTAQDAMARDDACLAAATLMLAAHGRGLGSCWIGLAQPWLDGPDARQRLGIPVGHTPIAPIILGYPKGPTLPPPRRPPIINRPVPDRASSRVVEEAVH